MKSMLLNKKSLFCEFKTQVHTGEKRMSECSTSIRLKLHAMNSENQDVKSVLYVAMPSPTNQSIHCKKQYCVRKHNHEPEKDTLMRHPVSRLLRIS